MEKETCGRSGPGTLRSAVAECDALVCIRVDCWARTGASAIHPQGIPSQGVRDDQNQIRLSRRPALNPWRAALLGRLGRRGRPPPHPQIVLRLRLAALAGVAHGSSSERSRRRGRPGSIRSGGAGSGSSARRRSPRRAGPQRGRRAPRVRREVVQGVRKPEARPPRSTSLRPVATSRTARCWNTAEYTKALLGRLTLEPGAGLRPCRPQGRSSPLGRGGWGRRRRSRRARRCGDRSARPPPGGTGCRSGSRACRRRAPGRRT